MASTSAQIKYHLSDFVDNYHIQVLTFPLTGKDAVIDTTVGELKVYMDQFQIMPVENMKRLYKAIYPYALDFDMKKAMKEIVEKGELCEAHVDWDIWCKWVLSIYCIRYFLFGMTCPITCIPQKNLMYLNTKM